MHDNTHPMPMMPTITSPQQSRCAARATACASSHCRKQPKCKAVRQHSPSGLLNPPFEDSSNISAGMLSCKCALRHACYIIIRGCVHTPSKRVEAVATHFWCHPKVHRQMMSACPAMGARPNLPLFFRDSDVSSGQPSMLFSLN